MGFIILLYEKKSNGGRRLMFTGFDTSPRLCQSLFADLLELPVQDCSLQCWRLKP